MRMRFSVLSIGLLAASLTFVQAAQASPDGATPLTGVTRAGVTYLKGNRLSRTVILRRDKTVSSQAQVEKLALIADTGAALILTDSYPSIPGSMSFCQAGLEQFLRVITIGSPVRPSREMLRLKVQSCRDGLELVDKGIEYDSGSSTLKVKWLTGPAVKGQPETRQYKISSSGNATLAPAR